jgi:DNA-nicking Smr family endonuclease
MENKESEEFIFGKEVDLHCFPAKTTKLVITEFIKQAIDFGSNDLIIIHGTGRSQKKREIHMLLDENEAVLSYEDSGSNWGRTIVYLK